MKKGILQRKRISIREYEREDRDRVINLLNAPSIKPKIWRWQFDERHYTSTIKPIVAEDNWGNILGFNGMMPIKLHTQEFGELEAAWSCDFFVSRHCRGLGVGKEIKRELKKQSPITFALGTSPTAATVLQQSGWIPYSEVYTYSGRFQKSLRNLPDNLVDSNSLPEAETLDKLWDTSKRHLNAAVVRDSAYLKWRYQDSPIARYRFVYEDNNDGLSFLAVYFESGNQITLVDYIGPEDKASLNLTLSMLAKRKPGFKCTTSSPALADAFIQAGLIKSERPSNCFIYSEDPRVAASLTRHFFIMTGDCDGDILGSSVAKAREGDQLNKDKYSVKQISFEQFIAMQSKWDDLVEQSDNPNLFGSWSWIKLWWEHFSVNHKFKLKLLICLHGNKLVGAAPMYQRKYKRFQFFTVRQLQFIGCSWSGPNTFRSEYLDLITNINHARGARLALLDHIFDQLRWEELVFGDLPHQSLTTRLIEESYTNKRLYPRTVHEDHSVIVNCREEQKDYIANLSANFRRSTVLKNDKLKASKPYEFAVYNQRVDCPINIVDTINTMHLPRWGKPCFEGQHKAFHEALIDQFSKSKKLNIATLSLDGEMSAITYNLTFGKTVYNIQLGYDESSTKGYSLGLIHLMNNILDCFPKPTYEAFDLLAGYGKSEFYKERFGGRIQNVSTRQYLRGHRLKLMYKIYDKWQRYKKFTTGKKHG